MSDLSPGGTNPSGVIRGGGIRVYDLGFGIDRSTEPVDTSAGRGQHSACRADRRHLLTTGGVKIGPSLHCDASFARFGLQLLA